MSYTFTGAPTEFNGTDPITGGDSGAYTLSLSHAHVPAYHHHTLTRAKLTRHFFQSPRT
ncbi:hypothetical protein BDU57DRAFT_516333 [Ampelomyces quisqualis]|uniref:Uncharacterized protein n=1 Tax=Ampelomyces quisqualis TaxID=50730 RepID=A0A6A5QNC8_AMPQU|nr:hypothetical protein BDU57DRAFT_516333 [Ampelomyces quisqualis]